MLTGACGENLSVAGMLNWPAAKALPNAIIRRFRRPHAWPRAMPRRSLSGGKTFRNSSSAAGCATDRRCCVVKPAAWAWNASCRARDRGSAADLAENGARRMIVISAGF